jgi:serine protease Do
MNKKRLTGFGILLVSLGILIGVILTSGFDLTGDLNADPNSPPQVEEGVTEQSTTPNDPGGQMALQALSDAFANVAEKVNPSVVTISTEQRVRTTQSPFGFPFEDFFGQRMPEREFTRQGLGSGVIVGEDGIILTNNHVVEGADDIVIRLLNDKEYKAEIKGVDPRTDLAVLKIDASDLPALKLGDSENLRVGEWVLAIGSPLQAEFAHTVTAGIVSAKGRRLSGISNPIQDFIQTDAAINPGNSGGALVNWKGELVGINTAIASRSGGNIGIGFAIPTNLARKVMTDILEKGKVVSGWLGVSISDIPEEVVKMYELKTDDGAFVREVVNDGPADKAGVEAGDIILEVSGKKLRNSTELSSVIGASEPGKAVDLKILRDGKEKTIKVKLEEFPEEETLIARSRKSSLESWGIEMETASRDLREKYHISGDEPGVMITSTRRGSISERLGLQEGDMIIRINRQYVSSVSEFSQAVGELESGDPVVLYIRRGDRKFVRDFILP